ncbi:MAG: response regulator transcription factor [Clostridia bacterium]|nr:response regulator transcription factor [Clostridia bacterium]
MHILIAEDEQTTARALKLMLERNKFTVDLADNGTDAWALAEAGGYDAIVLDIMMPGMSGLEVLKRIRAAGMSVPVMLLTAKSEIEDRVEGLEAGADDYLPKPFATPEFIARVKALCRRNGNYTDATLTLGNATLDRGKFTLTADGGSTPLTNKEFQLLELFFKNPGRIYHAESLMDAVWGLDSESNIEVVVKHVSLLRQELRKVDANIEIRTVRGAGYSLEVRTC